MFGLGWTELLLIGVVALIVIGPKDLPVVMNRLGKAVTSIRRMGSEFQREINKATGLDEIRDIRKSITEPIKATAAEIRSEFNKPMPGGGFEPSGKIKPKDPELESVIDEIHANLGMTAPQPIGAPDAVDTAKAPAAAKPVESPAPVEAIAPVKKPRAARKPKAAEPVAPLAAAEVKPAPKPRKPRAPKPKAEA
jgi:sec-independent protein translocase protein TatB